MKVNRSLQENLIVLQWPVEPFTFLCCIFSIAKLPRILQNRYKKNQGKEGCSLTLCFSLPCSFTVVYKLSVATRRFSAWHRWSPCVLLDYPGRPSWETSAHLEFALNLQQKVGCPADAPKHGYRSLSKTRTRQAERNKLRSIRLQYRCTTRCSTVLFKNWRNIESQIYIQNEAAFCLLLIRGLKRRFFFS